jgi:uncharacterized membrane protein
MSSSRTAWLGALAAGSVAWCVSIFLAAYLAGDGSAPARALAAPVYAIAAFVCHQLPERSFHLWTAQLPVCARCLGIYGGAAVMSSMLAVGSRRGDAVGPSVRAPKSLLAVAALPSVATLAYQWATGDPSANWIRAAAGIPLGAAAAGLIGTLR